MGSPGSIRVVCLVAEIRGSTRGSVKKEGSGVLLVVVLMRRL